MADQKEELREWHPVANRVLILSQEASTIGTESWKKAQRYIYLLMICAHFGMNAAEASLVASQVFTALHYGIRFTDQVMGTRVDMILEKITWNTPRTCESP